MKRQALMISTKMNPHPHSLVTLPTRTWFGLVSLFGATLVVCLLASATTVKAQQQGWSATGSLGTARSYHTATLLENGKVLVVGGDNKGGVLDGAEIYDPATGQWSATGSLSTPRVGHIAMRLANGKVLVAGGSGDPPIYPILTSAEIYDPDTGAWSAAGNLSVARANHLATLLADGRVLVTGGSPGGSSAELYDPATGAWSPAGTMNSQGFYPTATLLSDGNVLVVSGYSRDGVPQRTAELYDPATGRWTATSDLITARGTLTATLLPNAKVLVAGGETSSHCDQEDKAELYDPATRRWSATGSLTAPRGNHTATLLPNAKVLVAAGMNICNLLNSAEIYDPATGSWSVTRSLITTRIGHTATLLANGEVLVAGGYGTSFNSVASNSAELFEIKTPQITGASISGKRLFVEGKNFDAGAKIILNDEKQKTANDELIPTSLLIGKKAGKWIGLGETVRLKVRNSEGTESAEFSYTRPAG
jgi:N-acetylneuraminic acid mutarotase